MHVHIETTTGAKIGLALTATADKNSLEVGGPQLMPGMPSSIMLTRKSSIELAKAILSELADSGSASG